MSDPFKDLPETDSPLDSFGHEDEPRRAARRDLPIDRYEKSETATYRPVLRPPMGLLKIFDDGEESFELMRLRKSPFVIGRVEGDVVIPHDSQVSARHAVIERDPTDDGHAWYLRDLGSTNGTFVRTATLVLRPKQVMIIGNRRFDSSDTSDKEPAPAGRDATFQGSNNWQQLSQEGLAEMVPQLIDMTVGSSGETIALQDEHEQWIGRDPSCSIYLDDPTVDPFHAKIVKDEKGRWQVEDAQSKNGIWVQVRHINITRGAYFMCGEQKFAFKVL